MFGSDIAMQCTITEIIRARTVIEEVSIWVLIHAGCLPARNAIDALAKDLVGMTSFYKAT